MATMAGSNYTYITGATTTIIGPSAATTSLPTAGRRVNLLGICINKTLTGTLIVKSGATTIASFAIGTTPNTYLWTSDGGIEIADLQMTNSASEDITVAWNNF